MKTVRLGSGEKTPAFGMGTWRFGEDPNRRKAEIAVLRRGLDRGATLIDTAEMYGEGRAEEVVGEAIRGRRDDAFLVTKVYPHNASRKKMVDACERSLRRLGVDRIDLYLLHWRGNVPFAETLEAFASLREAGKIRMFGVSNLDLDDMNQWWSTPGGDQTATNQLLYNLVRRGIEWDLLPWLRERRVPVMAYSPIEQAELATDRRLIEFAKDCAATPAQVALAWLLARDDVIVIPKTAVVNRLEENLGALDLTLTPDRLAELDRLFPPPSGPTSLEML